MIKRKFRIGNTVILKKSAYILLNKGPRPLSKNSEYFVHLELEEGSTGKITGVSYSPFDGFFQVKIQLQPKVNIILDINQDDIEKH